MANYLIISPVRNEEKYIEKTINSVISQTLRPHKWIIVNDGSTDNTSVILKRYASIYPWIKVTEKKDRGFTQVGKGVMEAFYEGYNTICKEEFDFIVKLDCDVSFDNDYFQKLIKRFEQNKNLGICAGTSFTAENNKYFEEKMPQFHPWAGARMYRKRCFDDIGGLIISLGWDIVDIIRAQMRGWTTERLTDLRIIHHRRMSSRNGLWEGKLRTGKNFYITGYHPVFLIARSVYRLAQRPYFIESFGVIYGYIQAALNKEPLVVSKEEKKFVQRQQLRRLLGLKE